MKSHEQNQCKKKMLYHSLGIKMQINISSSFLLKLHENSEIINLKWELCITVLALKCHQRLLPVFFAEVSWKVKKKSKREKHSVTYYTIKDITDFILFFYWSFIKSREINQFERSTLYHSRFPLVFLLNLHERSKDRRDMKTQKE